MSASSIIGKKGTGVPTQLFHEGEGLTLTVETKTGIVYRGRADITEDNMNMTLRNAVATDVQGRQVRLDQVFVRGSQVMMVIYPDILKHAPMFERVRRVAAGKSVAAGLGKQRQQAIESKRGRGGGPLPGFGAPMGGLPGGGMSMMPPRGPPGGFPGMAPPPGAGAAAFPSGVGAFPPRGMPLPMGLPGPAPGAGGAPASGYPPRGALPPFGGGAGGSGVMPGAGAGAAMAGPQGFGRGGAGRGSENTRPAWMTNR